MAEPAGVRALYEAYIADAEALERNRGPMDGLFGTKGKPADDPRHDRFISDLRAALTAFSEAEHTPEDTQALLGYMYSVPLEHREPKSVYWMLMAVHGLALGLIGDLTGEGASALAARYAQDYPRRERMPVQNQTLRALTERQGAKAGPGRRPFWRKARPS